MGQDADAIRHDIELTRERMSERAEALAYKADVPARTKDKVREKKDTLMSAVTGRVQDVKESIVGAKDSAAESIAGVKDSAADSMSGTKDSVVGAIPDRDQIVGGAKQAKGMAETNPLGLAFGAIALGFLAGLAVPATRIENERIGPAADQLKSKVKDLGQDALDHGKQVVTEVAQAAKETAQEAGQEHAAELKDTATEQMGGSSSSQDEQQESTSTTTTWSDTPAGGRSGF